MSDLTQGIWTTGQAFKSQSQQFTTPIFKNCSLLFGIIRKYGWLGQGIHLPRWCVPMQP